MAFYEKFSRSLDVVAGVDFAAIFGDMLKAAKSGELLTDPAMLLSLVLIGVAGLIIVFCVLAFFMRRPSADYELRSSPALESRIHTLEVALLDQKNMLANMKGQASADFAYYKQEIKNLRSKVAELTGEKLEELPQLRVANRY